MEPGGDLHRAADHVVVGQDVTVVVEHHAAELRADVVAQGADDVLREAVAAGATSAVRVDASTELESQVVAVALAVASDDDARVREWMASGQLSKPTEDQIAAWKDETEERFTVVIVQPYVLAQRDSAPPKPELS